MSNISRRQFVQGLAAASVLPLATNRASAQAAWPNKPVKFIVPFPPGGGTDAFARPLGKVLTGQLGQTVLLDNRGGAGGTVGAEVAAARALTRAEALVDEETSAEGGDSGEAVAEEESPPPRRRSRTTTAMRLTTNGCPRNTRGTFAS